MPPSAGCRPSGASSRNSSGSPGMPTIADTLNAHLSGNDIASQVSAQAGHLGAVATTIEGLIAHPPQSVGDLLGSLQSFPLPDINVGGGLGTALSSLHGALPGDLSSLTGPVTSGLTQLQTTLGTDLAHAFTEGLQPILDLAKLVGTDFSCLTTPAQGAPGAPAVPGPGAPGSPPGSGTPAPPPGLSPGPAASPPAHPAPASALASIGSALGIFPSPLTLDSFLVWLVTLTGTLRASAVLPVPIPILDDVHDGLETLVAWKSKQPPAILADLVDAMKAVDDLVKASPAAAFGTLPADLAALPTQIAGTTLAQVADGVVARLGEIATAVSHGDLSGTGASITALGALLDQYDAARSQMQPTIAGLPAVQARLAHLPVDLDGAQGRLVALLHDSGTLQAGAPSGTLPHVDQAAIDAIGQVLSPVVAWLQDIAAKFDLSKIQGPITTVANGAKSAVDSVDSALAAVTTQVQHLFAQVESVIDGVDVAGLVGQVT